MFADKKTFTETQTATWFPSCAGAASAVRAAVIDKIQITEWGKAPLPAVVFKGTCVESHFSEKVLSQQKKKVVRKLVGTQ